MRWWRTMSKCFTSFWSKRSIVIACDSCGFRITTLIEIFVESPRFRQSPLSVSSCIQVQESSCRGRARVWKWCKAVHWTAFLCGRWAEIIQFRIRGHWCTAQSSTDASTVQPLRTQNIIQQPRRHKSLPKWGSCNYFAGPWSCSKLTSHLTKLRIGLGLVNRCFSSINQWQALH